MPVRANPGRVDGSDQRGLAPWDAFAAGRVGARDRRRGSGEKARIAGWVAVGAALCRVASTGIGHLWGVPIDCLAVFRVALRVLRHTASSCWRQGFSGQDPTWQTLRPLERPPVGRGGR